MKKFDHLIVIGRPACGKSEFIDFLKNQILEKDRLEKLYIAPFDKLDDFVWLWRLCEEDDIWEVLGCKRLVSKKLGHAYLVTNNNLWNFLIEKFNRMVAKRYLSNHAFYEKKTLLIEFSRGAESAYKNALNRFSKEILKKSAIFYIKVSYEESVHRNITRYQRKLKDSILAHKVPDEEMTTYYRYDDWDKLTSSRENGTLMLNGINVPFVTMNNEQESKDTAVLEKRYEDALRKLFELCEKGHFAYP